MTQKLFTQEFLPNKEQLQPGQRWYERNNDGEIKRTMVVMPYCEIYDIPRVTELVIGQTLLRTEEFKVKTGEIGRLEFVVQEISNRRSPKIEIKVTFTKQNGEVITTKIRCQFHDSDEEKLVALQGFYRLLTDEYSFVGLGLGGIGMSWFKTFVNANGAKYIKLQSTPKAEKFYKKMGFMHTGFDFYRYNFNQR